MAVVLPKGEIWTQKQTHIEGKQCQEEQGENHVKLKAKIETMPPQAKKCLGQLETDGGKEGNIFSKLQKEGDPADTLILYF